MSAATGRRGGTFVLRTVGRASHRRFECCATYQNFVFLGTSSGIDFNYVRESPVDFEWELTSVGAITAPKPVLQIAVLAELRVLLLLSDGQIFIHTFDPSSGGGEPNRAMLSSSPIASLKNVKDCVTFAVKKQDGMYTLAAALKSRRIVISVWRTGNFDMVKDLQSPEVPKLILWYGRRLMLCFSSGAKEYCALDIDTGKVSTLFDAKQTSLACYITGFKENLIVTQESLGLRLNENGATSKKLVRWSNPPRALLYVHPYLLSLHNSLIEVHFPHVAGRTFCQSFNLTNLESFNTVNYIDYDAPSPTQAPAGSIVKRDAVIALLGDGGMRVLVPFAISQQVTALAKDRQFDEANELVNLCPSDVNDALRLRLVLMHANHLFEIGNYGDALNRLAAARVDPRYAIRFFPGYLPAAVLQRWTPPDDTITQFQLSACSPEAATLLLSYLESWRANRPTSAESPSSIREAVLGSASDVMCTMAAIDTAVVMCLCDLGISPGKLLAEPSYVVFEEAQKKFLALQDYTSLGLLYLGLRDWKELEMLLRQLHRVAVLGHDDPTATLLPSAEVRNAALASILRSLIEASDSSTDRSDVLKYYDLSETRRVVDKFAAGVKSDERDALCRRFMCVTTTAYILKELDGSAPEQESLVLQHSLWILSSFHPSFGAQIFVKARKPIDSIKVAEFLEPFPSACSEFLRILMQPEPDAVKEEVLHQYRVSSLVQLIGDSTLSPTARTAYIAELSNFLASSSRYPLKDALQQVESLLVHDRSDSLVRSRTIIYRKLGLHKEAITLYLSANKLREAELYARDVSIDSNSGRLAASGERRRQNAFKFLIEAMLSRTEGTAESREKDVLDVISRNPQMDAVAALEVLPPSMKVADLRKFLTDALRASDAEARYRMITSNLLKSTHRSSDVVCALTKSVGVRITKDSRCDVCNRAIGASIFLRYPDGTLVHHGCATEKNISPKTGRDFTANVDLL